MYKLILSTIMLIWISFSTIAQDEEKFDKLFDLYIMEKYEDCLKKAISFTENEKYSKTPIPYLYVAMSYYEISIDVELQEDYPDAIKEATKYAAKFRKKDKDGSLYKENRDFFSKLKGTIMEEANTFYQLEDYKKAANSYKLILKFDEDPSIMFMYGTCSFLENNAGEGRLNILNAMKNINNTYQSDKISESALITAFIAYSDYLNTKNQLDSAKATISLAKEIFNTNTDISNQYSKIIGN